MLGAGLALALVPALRPPAFVESFLYLVFHWIALATSWTILSGFSGYFSFGHGAFFGAGMYTAATLAVTFGVPFAWTLPAAGVVAALLGLGSGAVVFREDHWLHRTAGPTGAFGTDRGRAIKAAIRKHFYPDADPWKEMVLYRAFQVIRQTVQGLAGG
mgnify:CR=1 FL=1